MATKKISQLEAAGTIAGTETIPIVQTTTKKITVDALHTGSVHKTTKGAATIGTTDQMTADGTFDTNTGWTAGTGWAISGGKATHTAGNTATLSGTTTMESNKVYKATVVISGYSAGSVNVLFGTYSLGLVLAANGTHTIYGLCSPAPCTFNIVPTSDFAGAIETVTLVNMVESEPNIILGTVGGQVTELRNSDGGYCCGIGWKNLSTLMPDGAYAGAKDSSGPAGPYRGINNVAIGDRALRSVVTGKYNVAVGQESMLRLTTGYNNTGVGDSALNNCASGFDNTALGYEVLGRCVASSQNTGVGSKALYAMTTGSLNTAVGNEAMTLLTTGGRNTAVGQGVLKNATTQGNNTGVGMGSLTNCIADNNTGCGELSAYYITSGTGNVHIGTRAGFGATTTNAPATDDYGILIGYRANRTVATATKLTNYIAIGTEALVTSSNSAVIGNSSLTDVYLGSTSGAAKLYASKARFTAIPTSADGLSAGDVWSNGGILTIVS